MTKKAGLVCLKAVFLTVLVVTFLVITGGRNVAQAQVSTNYTDEACSLPVCSSAQVCSGPTTAPEKQIQGAAVIGSPNKELQFKIQTEPQAIPSPSPTVNLDANLIFDLVNQSRTNAGLLPFEKDEKVCALAETRSTEIISEISNGTLHSGLYSRNLPYWIWENAKYGADEAGTVTWWLNSPLHRSSIFGEYKLSCVKCTGTYCSELFTNFSPKQ